MKKDLEWTLPEDDGSELSGSYAEMGSEPSSSCSSTNHGTTNIADVCIYEFTTSFLCRMIICQNRPRKG